MNEETIDNTPSYYLAENVGGEGESPDWFKSDKYKTVSDQAKAYAGIEKKLGEMGDKLGSFTGAPEQYDVVLPEGVTINQDDPIFSQAQDWARSNNLNQDGFNSLVEMYATIEAARNKAWDDELSSVRASIENFDSREKNISDFLTANEMPDLAGVITSKEALEQFEKLLDMTGKPSLSVEGEGSNIPTQEEIDKLMFEKDEYGRTYYSYDKERQAKVRKMLEMRVGKGTYNRMVG